MARYSQDKLSKVRLFPLGISTSQCTFYLTADSKGKITSIVTEVNNKRKIFEVQKLKFQDSFKEAETFLAKNLVLTKIKGKKS